jgi:hypothetical protein
MFEAATSSIDAYRKLSAAMAPIAVRHDRAVVVVPPMCAAELRPYSSDCMIVINIASGSPATRTCGVQNSCKFMLTQLVKQIDRMHKI